MNITQLRAIAKDTRCTSYYDYRSWLKSLYIKAKSISAKYSYIQYSKDLGVGSSNAHNIITGKRKLTRTTASHIIKALKLTAKETKFLHALIDHESATEFSAKEAAYEKIVALKGDSLSDEKAKNEFKFFTNWYNLAIYEMLRLENSSDSPKWLSDNLNPTVSVPNVKKSLALLQQLGYITKQDGKLKPSEKLISTGNEVRSFAVASAHHQMIELAKESINTQNPTDREISAVTLSIPRDLKETFREEIIQFRKKLIAMSEENQSNKDEVVQVNIQLFSLGKAEEKTEG